MPVPLYIAQQGDEGMSPVHPAAYNLVLRLIEESRFPSVYVRAEDIIQLIKDMNKPKDTERTNPPREAKHNDTPQWPGDGPAITDAKRGKEIHQESRDTNTCNTGETTYIPEVR